MWLANTVKRTTSRPPACAVEKVVTRLFSKQPPGEPIPVSVNEKRLPEFTEMGRLRLTLGKARGQKGSHLRP